MPSRSFTDSERLQEAQAYVVFLNRVFSAVKLGIEAERILAPSSNQVIQTEILKTKRQLEKIQRQIHEEEQKCQRLQRGIDELNRWYCGTTQPGLDKLGVEITRRSQAIHQAKDRIRELETEKRVLMIHLKKQQAQLATVPNGVDELPIETDPRLVAARTALNAAQNELKAMQSEAASKTLQSF